MKLRLNLECNVCGKVKEANWCVDELIDASPDEICLHCFICPDCLIELEMVDPPTSSPACL